MCLARRSSPFHDLGHCRFADTKLLGDSDLCFARVPTLPDYGNFLLQSQVATAHCKAGKLAHIRTGLATRATLSRSKARASASPRSEALTRASLRGKPGTVDI